jgi:hypothetical protein
MAAPAVEALAAQRAALLAELPELDRRIASGVPAREERAPLIARWKRTTPAPGARIQPATMTTPPLSDSENRRLCELNATITAGHDAAMRRQEVLRGLRTTAPTAVLARVAAADRACVGISRVLPTLELSVPDPYASRLREVYTCAQREYAELDAALVSRSWAELRAMV